MHVSQEAGDWDSDAPVEMGDEAYMMHGTGPETKCKDLHKVFKGRLYLSEDYKYLHSLDSRSSKESGCLPWTTGGKPETFLHPIHFIWHRPSWKINVILVWNWWNYLWKCFQNSALLQGKKNLKMHLQSKSTNYTSNEPLWERISKKAQME